MATVLVQVPQILVARLTAAPAVGATVRRVHRTPVPRKDAPAVDVWFIGGTAARARNNCVQWEGRIRVRVQARTNTPDDELEPLLLSVLERIDPVTEGFTAYPSNVAVELQGFEVDEEVADQDYNAVTLGYGVLFFAEENRLEVVPG